MSLIENINNGIKEAMRSKEKDRLEALRAVKTALVLEMSKSAARDLDEKEEMQILTRLHKQRKESSAIFKEQGREDLAENEDFQAGVLEEFLPKQLSEAEVAEIVSKIIEETGASSMKDMGKVMGKTTAILAGKADGKLIADLVKKKLG